MKQVGTISLASLLFFTLLGCGSYGSKSITSDELVSQVKVGQSTKADVKRILGDPAFVNFTESMEEVWQYNYSRSEASASTFIPVVGAFIGSQDTEMHTLTIRYDKNGVVKAVGKGKSSGSAGGIGR